MIMQMLSYPGSAEIIIDGPDVYIGGDMYEGILPAGAWLYVDAEDAPPVWGEVADDLLSVNDAAVLLYWLLGADGTVDVIGREYDEGGEVLHAAVPIDLDIALERTPPGQQAVFASNLAGIRGRGGDVDTAELWLDGNGMVRRIVYDMEWPVGDASSTWEFDTEFEAFGEPLDLRLPDAEDIIDAWDVSPQGVE